MARSISCTCVVVFLFLIVLFSFSFANNPDGSSPYWYGRFGEMVNMKDGELIMSNTDVSLPARGQLSLTFTRYFNCETSFLDKSTTEPPCTTTGRAMDGGEPKPLPVSYAAGHGWRQGITQIIYNNQPSFDYMIMYEDGNYEVLFEDGNGNYKTNRFAVLKDTIVNQVSQKFLYYPDGTIFQFDYARDLRWDSDSLHVHLLKKIIDPTRENELIYSYAGYADRKYIPIRIEDSEGRYIQFNYDADTNLFTSMSRMTSLNYGGKGNTTRTINYYYSMYDKNLIEVVYPNNDTIKYTYTDVWYDNSTPLTSSSDEFLESIEYPNGGKVYFTFECYKSKIYVAGTSSTIEYYTQHVAIKDIKYDDGRDTVTFAEFERTGGTSYFLSKAKVACEDCINTTIHEWKFYPERTLPTDTTNPNGYIASSGLLKEYKRRGAEDYAEVYWDTSSANDCGWEFVDIGDIDDSPQIEAWYPHLKGKAVWDIGYNENQDAFRYPFRSAKMDARTGIDTSKIILGTSSEPLALWHIEEGIYDEDNNRFFPQMTQYNDFATRLVYESYDQDSIPTSTLIKHQYHITNYGTRDSVRTSYDYDQYGNIIRIYDDNGDPTDTSTCSMRYTYETTSNTFVKSMKNKAGLVTRTDYDPYIGVLLKHWTPTGANKEYTYDTADRLDYVQDFDGTTRKTIRDITYNTSSNPKHIVETVLTGTTNESKSTTSYFNEWGQICMKDVSGLLANGDQSRQVFEYDIHGRLKQNCKPYSWDLVSDTAEAWTVYNYDGHNRPMAIDYPNTTNEDASTSYNETDYDYGYRYGETEDWSGRKVKKTWDKFGRVTDIDLTSADLQSHDYTDVTFYGRTNLPDSINDAGSEVTSWVYDKWHRVRSVTRPTIGTTLSYADKLGNIRFSKDANGLWTYFMYDDIYRLTEIGIASDVDTTEVDDITYKPTDDDTTKIKYYYGEYNLLDTMCYYDEGDSTNMCIVDTLLNRYDVQTISEINNHDWIKGKLTQVEDEACTTRFVYDRLGRVVLKYINYVAIKDVNGVSIWQPVPMHIAYDYNWGNNITSMRYPYENDYDADSSYWVDYKYYDSGLLRYIPNYLSNANYYGIKYEPWGAVAEMNHDNGISTTYEYDDLLRITDMDTRNSGDTLIFSEDYKYHDHLLTKIYDVVDDEYDRSFQYDYRDRLYRVDYDINDTNWWEKYYYNENNTRDSVSINGDSTKYNNYHPGTSKLKNVSTTQGDTLKVQYTYDNNGNMVNDSTKLLDIHYNYRNLIEYIVRERSVPDTLSDTIFYSYNYKNHRIMKLYRYWDLQDCGGGTPQGDGGDMMVGGDEDNPNDDSRGCAKKMKCWVQISLATFYVWSGDQVIMEFNEENYRTDQYIYANSQRVARTYRTNIEKGKIKFIHTDYIGSLRLLTDTSEAVIMEQEYLAWGNAAAISGTPLNYTFTGQEWDTDMGSDLFYHRNRYYDPKIGRFTSPDPIISDLNPYSYCNNNPVMLVDPLGLDAWLKRTPNTENKLEATGVLRPRSWMRPVYFQGVCAVATEFAAWSQSMSNLGNVNYQTNIVLNPNGNIVGMETDNTFIPIEAFTQEEKIALEAKLVYEMLSLEAQGYIMAEQLKLNSHVLEDIKNPQVLSGDIPPQLIKDYLINSGDVKENTWWTRDVVGYHYSRRDTFYYNWVNSDTFLFRVLTEYNSGNPPGVPCGP